MIGTAISRTTRRLQKYVVVICIESVNSNWYLFCRWSIAVMACLFRTVFRQIALCKRASSLFLIRFCDEDVCCSSECGVCGGDKCSWRPGGRFNLRLHVFIGPICFNMCFHVLPYSAYGIISFGWTTLWHLRLTEDEDAKDERISSSFAKQCINCILRMHMLANPEFCSIKVPQVNGVVLEPFAPWGTFALTRQILEALGMRSFFLDSMRHRRFFAVSIGNWMLKNHVKFSRKDAWRPPFFTRTACPFGNSGRGMPNSTAPTCWNAHTAFNLWEVEWDGVLHL